MLSIEHARELLEENLKTETTRLHCREVEVIMRALARKLGENEDEWALAGILHDMDCDIADIKNQGMKAAEILEKEDVPEGVLHAIKAHNEENTGVVRESKIDFALSAADNISGLIFATALVYPDKRLEPVKAKSILKRMKDKRFAASVHRENIRDIERVGLSLEEFAELALNAMKEIANEIGL